MKKRLLIITALIIMVCGICACATGAKNDSIIPFSQISLGTAAEDVIAQEGDSYETYDSLYHGDTYTYEREYLGQPGTVKYMYDEADNLVCIAWACEAESAEALSSLFDRAVSEFTRLFGEQSEEPSSPNIMGAVWRKDGSNIVISSASFADSNVMQIAFMAPEISANVTTD